MRIKNLGSAVLLALAAPTLAGAAAFEATARLTAAQEVADNPVTSDGVARAVVRFDEGFTEVRIRLRFFGLDGNVGGLHFHCNVAGANGPIGLGVVSPGPLTVTGNQINGTLTNADFPPTDACEDVIGFPVNNVASLAAAIDRGLVYLNLHTDAWPAGEVRGQLFDLDQDGDD